MICLAAREKEPALPQYLLTMHCTLLTSHAHRMQTPRSEHYISCNECRVSLSIPPLLFWGHHKSTLNFHWSVGHES